MNNSETVRKMYEAYGRRDIKTILSHVAENIEWEYGGTKDIPWLTPRKGVSGARDFFKELDALDVKKFTPKAILEKDNMVVGIFDFDATHKQTGKRIQEQDEVHIFYFNNEGKVIRFRHRADTHQQFEALQPMDRRRDTGRPETRPTM
jgi:ketosteroid isomerase-like protein